MFKKGKIENIKVYIKIKSETFSDEQNGTT